jgi:hypothetical protein
MGTNLICQCVLLRKENTTWKDMQEQREIAVIKGTLNSNKPRNTED